MIFCLLFKCKAGILSRSFFCCIFLAIYCGAPCWGEDDAEREKAGGMGADITRREEEKAKGNQGAAEK